MASTGLLSRLFPGFGENKAGKVRLLIVSPADYEKTAAKAAKMLSGTPTIYACIGRLWRDTNDMAEKAGADTSEFHWIGASGVGFWSHDHTLRGKQAENVTLIEGPTALVHLSMVMDLLLQGKKYDCAVIDSVDAMLAKNKPATALKILEITAKKLRAAGIAGIFICSGKESAKSMGALEKFCDGKITAKDLK